MTDTTPALPTLDLWVGSYTADAGGKGEGIGTLRVASGRPERAGLATAAPSPSFLAKHPTLPLVYAVGESAETVRAFRVTAPGTLEAAGEAWPAGAAACHVAVDPAGRFLVVSCWGDGQVLLYELDDAGAITNRLAAAAAVDPHGASGRPTRAHAALMLPDGRVATTDLGFDLLRVWRYEPGTGLVADHEVVFPKSSEPRHLVRHPSGRILVIGEVSVTVFVLAANGDGRFAIESSTPASREGARPGDTASEISVDASGGFAQVSVRGSDYISTLAVHDDGARLEPIADVPCGGSVPRHHLQIGRMLLVANQASSTVTAFRLDAYTGVPEHLTATFAVGSPTCLLPA